MRLSDVTPVAPFPGAKSITKFVAYGASVLNDSGATEKLGANIGRIIRPHPDIRIVESVLFGTGSRSNNGPRKIDRAPHRVHRPAWSGAISGPDAELIRLHHELQRVEICEIPTQWPTRAQLWQLLAEKVKKTKHGQTSGDFWARAAEIAGSSGEPTDH
jgi:hypothetical protein